MKKKGEYRKEKAPEWTGKLVGEMHIYDVSRDALAEELNCSKGYVCLVLNGQKSPKGGSERFTEAFINILKRRAANG